MQWSRLRASVRDLLAPSVAGRVDVPMAGYGSSSTDRAWLALDGRDVLTIPEYSCWPTAGGMQAARRSPARPEGVLLHEGRVTTIGTLLHRSLDRAFADLVASPTVFLRGFARFDRRFGHFGRRIRCIDRHRGHTRCRAWPRAGRRRQGCLWDRVWINRQRQSICHAVVFGQRLGHGLGFRQGLRLGQGGGQRRRRLDRRRSLGLGFRRFGRGFGCNRFRRGLWCRFWRGRSRGHHRIELGRRH